MATVTNLAAGEGRNRNVGGLARRGGICDLFSIFIFPLPQTQEMMTNERRDLAILAAAVAVVVVV